jgi:aspartyl-tRNA(Asn)/glutamyl-tRNA(Gln) amidotransferase subunit A
MTTIADLSAAEMTQAYARGALSPVEVARDTLGRIARHADLNAFILVDADAALAAAAASQARWRAGTALGAVDGVPATIKDSIWVRGLPTRRGSATSGTEAAPADSAAVARLREQGAVILGKTNLPEHGWIGVCHSPLTGITRNPWNVAHTPGGSTGGGAVAALLGLGLLHLGTDGAGSLRIPAAFSGVFGIKPSFGLVPAFPASLFGALSHQGPVARSVADAALMLSVISGPDLRDMTAWNAPAQDFLAGLDAGVAGLRIAYSPRLGSAARPEAEIEAAARKAAGALQEQGASVEEADPPLAGALELIRAMWWPVATAIVDAVPAARRAEMDPGLLDIAERGRRYSVADYLAASTARAELYGAMRRFHERYDLLLTPTMPITAPKVGLVVPEGGAFGDDWLNWSPYTYPFNLTQQPAASVPSGLAADGLPMGVQIVGRPREDRLVLQAARAIERALPMPRLPETVISQVK